MAMPAARGLFHKAIIQSGPAVQMASPDDASETARQLLAELNLSSDKVRELRPGLLRSNSHGRKPRS